MSSATLKSGRLRFQNDALPDPQAAELLKWEAIESAAERVQNSAAREELSWRLVPPSSGAMLVFSRA
jgi:hypothetical protein